MLPVVEDNVNALLEVLWPNAETPISILFFAEIEILWVLTLFSKALFETEINPVLAVKLIKVFSLLSLNAFCPIVKLFVTAIVTPVKLVF